MLDNGDDLIGVAAQLLLAMLGGGAAAIVCARTLLLFSAMLARRSCRERAVGPEQGSMRYLIERRRTRRHWMIAAAAT
jgi:hypothetical protein